MKEQLTLPIEHQASNTLDNFIKSGNEALLLSVQESLPQNTWQFYYLYGVVGSGRTHLLQGCCYQFNQNTKSCVYLDGLEITSLSPLIFEGLEALQLVCIDNVDALIGKSNWEEALFHLYNRLHASNSLFMVSANSPLKALGTKLADLHSRFCAGLTYQVKPLSDDDKGRALMMRADEKGFHLPQEVTQYLVRHTSRNITELFRLLELLDKASLSQKRKITIPLVKSVLDAKSSNA